MGFLLNLKQKKYIEMKKMLNHRYIYSLCFHKVKYESIGQDAIVLKKYSVKNGLFLKEDIKIINNSWGENYLIKR